jgi:hypothetical protein
MYTLYDTYVMRDDGAYIPLDESNRDFQDYLAWVAAGNTPNSPPLPTFADYYTQFMGNFTQWIEDVAHSNGYDSALSCISYLNSGVPQFAADALSLKNWRDALWVWAANWQTGFNGQMPDPIPSWDDVKAQAPQPEAYGWEVHDPRQIIASATPTVPIT